MSKKGSIFIFLILILGAIAYFNCLSNEFVWDDQYLIIENEQIRSLKYALNLFRHPLYNQLDERTNYYRPLQMLSYMLDYQIWKLNPLGYHLTSIFIHLANACLLYLLISLFAKNRFAAFVAAGLFCVHPVHAEALTYISGRPDPLATSFILLSLLCYIRSTRKGLNIVYYFLSLGLYFFSLFCKETSLMFILVLILYEISLSKSTITFRPKYRYLGFVLVTGIYLLLRYRAVGGLLMIPQIHLNIAKRILLAPRILLSYLRLLLLPVNLHMEYRVALPHSFFEPAFFFSLLTMASFLLLLPKIWRLSRPAFFGLGWFLLNFLPLSNLFNILNASMAEHWLYLPSVGLFLALGIGVKKLWQKDILWLRRLTISALIFLLAVSIYLTRKRNQDWRNSIAIFRSTLKYTPQSARVHSDLGQVYFKKGMLTEAEEEFKQAVKIKPNYIQAHYNLGSVYFLKKGFSAAIKEYEKVLSLKPGLINAHINLGIIYTQQKRYAPAIKQFNQALKIDPESTLADFYLRTIYKELGQ